MPLRAASCAATRGSIEPELFTPSVTRMITRLRVFEVRNRLTAVASACPIAVPLPIQRQNPFTGQVETIYTHIRGELDEPTLTAIADTTGGEFFRATDARALARVLQRIDALEKTRMTSPKREQIDELYVWPLAAGLALLVLAVLTGETLWMKVPA